MNAQQKVVQRPQCIELQILKNVSSLNLGNFPLLSLAQILGGTPATAQSLNPHRR